MNTAEFSVPAPVELHNHVKPPQFSRGSVVTEHMFEPHEVLASNANNLVYRADMPGVGVVALKLFGETSEYISDRTTAELEAHQELNGRPEFVGVAAMGTMSMGRRDYRYLATRFAEGGDLRYKSLKNGQISVDGVLKMASDVLSGLVVMHDNDMIHRDVKPSNIVHDTGEDRFKLTDFTLIEKGLVMPTPQEVRHLGSISLDNATLSDSLVGTLGFAAPEAAFNDGPVGPQEDMFGFGSTLYDVTTGHLPYDIATENQPVPSLMTYLESIVNEAPVPAHMVNDSVPVELGQLDVKLLSLDPFDRGNAAEALEVVEEIRQRRGSGFRKAHSHFAHS